MTRAFGRTASPTSGAPTIYRFEGFSVDTARWELCDRHGVNVPLATLPFRLLLLLIEQRARVVPKEELFEALWNDTAVCENSLSQAISMVRRALGGGELGARWIQSVRGRGYRFAAGLEELGSSAASSGTDRQRSTRLIPSRQPSGLARERQSITPTREFLLLGRGTRRLSPAWPISSNPRSSKLAAHGSPSRARLLAWLAWSLHGANQQARTSELLGEALAMARRLDSAATPLECLRVAQSTPQALAARPLRLLGLIEAIARSAATELRELTDEGLSPQDDRGADAAGGIAPR